MDKIITHSTTKHNLVFVKVPHDATNVEKAKMAESLLYHSKTTDHWYVDLPREHYHYYVWLLKEVDESIAETLLSSRIEHEFTHAQISKFYQDYTEEELLKMNELDLLKMIIVLHDCNPQDNWAILKYDL